MKVKDLIAALSEADPEATVCQFTEDGSYEIENIGVFKGEYRTDMAPKLIWGYASGEYVGIGNPGDYEVSNLQENCQRIRDLLE